MFAFSAESDQSFLNARIAGDIARGILAQLPEGRIVMTSHRAVVSADARIVSGHELSFRENAELTRYCTLLIGCSSGITWLATSEWARRLPTIQLLTRGKGVFASVAHDHEHFGLPVDHIIEMTDCPLEDVVDCVVVARRESFAEAKTRYHVRLQPDFDFYLSTLRYLIRKGNYRDALASNWHILRRYGPRRSVLRLHGCTLKYILRHAFGIRGRRCG